MKHKFLKYYSYIPHIYSIAFILDPRFRLAALEQCLDYYYASFFGPLPMYDDKAIIPKQQFQEVSNLLYQLFNEFHAQYGNASPPPPRTSSSSKGKSILKSAFGNLMKKSKSTPVNEQSSINELSLYLTFLVEYEEGDDFDVFQWWKEKERTFPILSKMAKQVLAILVSTVAVEQEFSAAGNVLTDYRTRLSANSLETPVCFHDWLKAKRRTQEISIEPTRHFMEETTEDDGNSD
ncbi:unnamed protein product [Cuscuta europaea]|uniref:HAT C-terminal dimerisation domain-containing protein n=1 Tax=Cuscuta europaea TaxID=41803 RepID=A0A9P0ZNZ7_CUSEU|nr:unnamed protein product [Cuscuta europaea]